MGLLDRKRKDTASRTKTEVEKPQVPEGDLDNESSDDATALIGGLAKQSNPVAAHAREEIDGNHKDTASRTKIDEKKPQVPEGDSDNESSVDTKVNSKGLLARQNHSVSVRDVSAGELEAVHTPVNSNSEQNKESSLQSTMRSIHLFIHFLRIVCAFASMLLLVLIANQVTTLIQTISALWMPLAWLCYVLLGLFGIFILYAAYRVIRVFIKLRPVKKNKIVTSLGGPVSVEDQSRLESELRKWLAKYQLDETQVQHLEKLGMTTDHIGELKKHRDRLLDTTDFANSKHFAQQFVKDVQTPLDRLAKQQRKHRAKLVAVKTAVSPSSTIDGLVVLYHSWQMVTDICRIYGVRPSSWDSFCILSHTVFNSYIAIKLDEFQDPLEDFLEGAIKSTFKSKYLTIITLGLATGIANGLMLNRVGRRLEGLIRIADPDVINQI